MTAPDNTAPDNPRPKTTRRRRTMQPAVVELPPGEDREAGSEPTTGAPAADLDAIFPDPASFTVLGIPARVRRLQTREVMAVIRIVINEMGATVTELDFNALAPDADPKAKEIQKQHLLGFLIVALPNAADEIIKLLAGLVEAKDSKQAEDLEAVMYNPPPAVTLDLMSVVWDQERDDLAALLGKARQLFGMAAALQRTGRAGT